jgi:hypothetical protein
VFSEVAERVELCLRRAGGPERRVDMDEVNGFVWLANQSHHQVHLGKESARLLPDTASVIMVGRGRPSRSRFE